LSAGSDIFCRQYAAPSALRLCSHPVDGFERLRVTAWLQLRRLDLGVHAASVASPLHVTVRHSRAPLPLRGLCALLSSASARSRASSSLQLVPLCLTRSCHNDLITIYR